MAQIHGTFNVAFNKRRNQSSVTAPRPAWDMACPLRSTIFFALRNVAEETVNRRYTYLINP